MPEHPKIWGFSKGAKPDFCLSEFSCFTTNAPGFKKLSTALMINSIKNTFGNLWRMGWILIVVTYAIVAKMLLESGKLWKFVVLVKERTEN